MTIEIEDLERHLASKITVAIGDVIQLLDDPKDRARILSSSVGIIFLAAIDLIGDCYEDDTGKKANPVAITSMLLRECFDLSRSAHPLEPRASKPRKPAARSS